MLADARAATRVLGQESATATALHILYAIVNSPDNAGTHMLRELGARIGQLRNTARFTLGSPQQTRDAAGDFDTVAAYIVTRAQVEARRIEAAAPGAEPPPARDRHRGHLDRSRPARCIGSYRGPSPGRPHVYRLRRCGRDRSRYLRVNRTRPTRSPRVRALADRSPRLWDDHGRSGHVSRSRNQQRLLDRLSPDALMPGRPSCWER